MDPSDYSQTRLLRFSSHQANSATYQGNWTNANFQCSLENDLQQVGAIRALGIESIGFANVFPNVRPTYNTFLIRQGYPALSPQMDDALGGSVYSWRTSTGQTFTVTPPSLGPLQTIAGYVATMNAFLTGAGTNNYPVLTADPSGVINVTFNGSPCALIGPAWTATCGIPLNQINKLPAPNALNGYYVTLAANPLYSWKEVRVAAGFYDADELALAVQTAGRIALNNVNFTVTVGGAPLGEQRFIMSLPGVGISICQVQDPTDPARFDNRTLLTTMGFGFEPSVLFGAPNQNQPTAVDITAQFLPNLLGETVLFLHSQMLSQQIKSYQGEGPPDYCIASIPITVGYGESQTVFFNQHNGVQLRFLEGMLPSVVDITFKNVFGDFLDNGDNQQAFVVLRAWY